MMRLFTLGACVVCLLVLTSVAGAETIIEHLDNIDPATEGWAKDATGSYTAAANAGPPLNWKITCGTTTSCRYRYRATEGLEEADFQDPTGWTSTVRMQFNESDCTQVWNTLKNGSWYVGWGWDDDVDDDPLTVDPDIFINGMATGLFGLGGAIDPTDGFHYYQMIYDPTADEVTWYLDGSSVHSAASSELASTSGLEYYFGDSNSQTDSPPSESQFALARLETGQHVIDPGEPIPGDANLDKIVNDADASILAAHWQQSGAEIGWGDGDFNGDNVVNDADASILAAHWQETQEGAAPVPEPSVQVLLLGAGLIGLLARARRRR